MLYKITIVNIMSDDVLSDEQPSFYVESLEEAKEIIELCIKYNHFLLIQGVEENELK